jgi:hypothetical protein
MTAKTQNTLGHSQLQTSELWQAKYDLTAGNVMQMASYELTTLD